MSKPVNRNTFARLMQLAGFTGDADAQLQAFVDYFRTERKAADIETRFDTFTGKECLRLVRSMGHHGMNATTTHGLCRWLLKHFGLELVSHRYTGRAQNRRRIYHLLNPDIQLQPQWIDTEPRPPRQRVGYVYVLQALPTNNIYKIGRAKDPHDRKKTFDVKLPFPTEYKYLIKTDDMHALEAELHDRFDHARLNGEWFTLTADDLDYLKALADALPCDKVA